MFHFTAVNCALRKAWPKVSISFLLRELQFMWLTFNFAGICYLGYRSGAPMSILESRAILAGRGSVDYTRLQWVSNKNKTFQIVCEVTFAYVDDCKDAIKVS